MTPDGWYVALASERPAEQTLPAKVLDKWLQSVQRTTSRTGAGLERTLETDAPARPARRVYALACAGGWPRDHAGFAERRIITVPT